MCFETFEEVSWINENSTYSCTYIMYDSVSGIHTHLWAWLVPIPLDLFLFQISAKRALSKIELQITSISLQYSIQSRYKLQVHKLQITSNIAGFWQFHHLLATRGRHHTVFTFVREPLARFISGFAEIERRAAEMWCDESRCFFLLFQERFVN